MTANSELIQKAWAAINLEIMTSRAWALCFANEPDLKFNEYREIIFVVMLLNAVQPDGCILSCVQKKITNAYNLDSKTVTTKILRLVDDGFFIIEAHPKDRRKKCIRPTHKLIRLFDKYNQIVPSIVNEIRTQMTLIGTATSTLELEPILRFNITDLVRIGDDRLYEEKSLTHDE
jgi:DNA-binding MarR family transcriptional regulator